MKTYTHAKQVTPGCTTYEFDPEDAKLAAFRFALGREPTLSELKRTGLHIRDTGDPAWRFVLSIEDQQ